MPPDEVLGHSAPSTEFADSATADFIVAPSNLDLLLNSRFDARSTFRDIAVFRLSVRFQIALTINTPPLSVSASNSADTSDVILLECQSTVASSSAFGPLIKSLSFDNHVILFTKLQGDRCATKGDGKTPVSSE